jgi:GAF domain-containing protein
VCATGETLNIPDADSDPRFNSAVDRSTGYQTRSILCVAIRSGRGGLVGCTQMINKLGAPEFPATDQELMTAFNVF